MIETHISIPLMSREIVNPESVALTTQLRLSPYEPQQLIRLPLADAAGRADAPQILAWLNAAIEQFGRSPWIRAYTESILPRYTRNNDQVVILRTIANFVRDKLRYLADPEGSEYFIDPVELIQRINDKGYAFGDCDEHVSLLCSMARSVGFDARAVGVHLNDPVLWDHVIAQVHFNGRWLDIDPCVKSSETPDYRDKLV